MVLLQGVSELAKSPPLPDPPPRWGEGTGGGQTVAVADVHEQPDGSLSSTLPRPGWRGLTVCGVENSW